MNWLEKVEKLKITRKTGEARVDICLSTPAWKEDELEQISRQHHWIPQSYIIYLREFDSTSIAFCNFYGSKNCDGIPLESKIQEYKPLLKDEFFPFWHRYSW